MLASALLQQGHDVITSIAGRTSAPTMPAGKVRVGGFGGRDGLQRFLGDQRIDIIADATHPFAAQMSANAFAAGRDCGIDYVRLDRPAWRAGEGDRWIMAQSTLEAARILPRAARIFLTIGSKRAHDFTGRADLRGLIRTIEPLREPVPETWSAMVAHPPFTVEEEASLLRQHRLDVVVTKNAGGELTAAKLVAARELGLQVVMIERPLKPRARTAETVEEMVRLVSDRAS